MMIFLLLYVIGFGASIAKFLFFETPIMPSILFSVFWPVMAISLWFCLGKNEVLWSDWDD